MSYPRQTTFETSTQMSSITFRIYRPWLIPNLFQSEILSSFEKIKTLKSFTFISQKNSNSWTRRLGLLSRKTFCHQGTLMHILQSQKKKDMKSDSSFEKSITCKHFSTVIVLNFILIRAITELYCNLLKDEQRKESKCSTLKCQLYEIL